MNRLRYVAAFGAFAVAIAMAATGSIGCAARSTPPAAATSREWPTANSDKQLVGNHHRRPDEPQTDASDVSSDDDVNDDIDETPRAVARQHQSHPFDSISDASLRATFEKYPETLGSISVGRPNAGQLINGVRPGESPLYRLVNPSNAWGTTETVEALCHAIEAVTKAHPGTPVVDIGDISSKSGGPLHPHHSHQSGRDVDLGLYYRQSGTRWYTRATRDSLDVERTWTLIRSLVTDTDIELILLDRSLQEVVEEYAISVERDAKWVRSLFRGDGTRRAVIRHSPGHCTHLHLRFFNPIAEESARRLIPYITVHHVVRASVTTRTHVATSGDTLAKLAQRYHTTMSAIRRANRMQGFQLVAGRHYLIPSPEPAPEPAPRH